MSDTRAMSDHEYRENVFFSTFGSVPEPAFHDPQEMTNVWGRQWGCTNDVGKLRAVLMRRPGDELNVVDTSKELPETGGYGDPEKGWYWISRQPPNLAAMQKAHDQLTSILRAEGVDVILIDKAAPGAMKQVYTRDSCIGIKGGAIVTRLARKVRRGEELPVTQTLAAAGCPILGTITGTGIFEGGGFAMIDEKTAVCCVSIACNEEGVRQLEAILNYLGVELIKLPMPGYRIHIDGAFNMIDVDKAIVNTNELPYFFIEYLKKRGIQMIQLPPEDSPFSLNSLAIAPGKLVMHGSRTKRLEDRLDAAGITLITCDYEPVELGGGGIHCSTAPLARDAI
ncbi:MAG: amidinotransferase [Cereibacter sphaeroides]|uniref:arginine deiminase n=1 Tax=Cereibacter sphaeroides TaxID=1063 RepID=A0A2W5UCX1_CERSP|nr:MAG: amidinotransferase [Cereibacter sphaeroides]